MYIYATPISSHLMVNKSILYIHTYGLYHRGDGEDVEGQMRLGETALNKSMDDHYENVEKAMHKQVGKTQSRERCCWL